MKTHISIIAVSLALLTLSGCKSLYGKYERPELRHQQVVRDTADTSRPLAETDTASFGKLPWRQVFTDPQLQQLITMALANNTDLANAFLNIDMAEAQLKAAKLAFLPSFSFTPQGTIASWDGNKATQTYSLPINASWNVDLWGSLRASKRGAQAALLQMRDYRVSVQSALVANVANAYYTLLMLDEQVKILDDMTRLTKETWDIMKVQKSLGRVRSTGVQSAENNYYSTLTQRADLMRQIRETENALSLLLNQPGAAIPRGTLAEQRLPETWSTGVSLQLLNNRADVHAQEMKLAQCFYDVEVARARFYPQLTISGNGIFTNSGGMGITNPGAWLLSAVGSLVQPIFQNGKLVAGLRAAKDQYQQAYNSWQTALLKAGNEVSNALVLYNTSAEKSALEAKQVAVLQQNVADTRALMGSSTTTYLEVITAQSALLSAQLAKVQDDFRKMQAVVNLYNALGGGAE